MGFLFSKIFATLGSTRPNTKIVMVGLDGAGKTTILYKLKSGEVVNTTPTIGFNVETVDQNNVKMDVWDVGGQDKIRPLWRHYFQGTDAIVYVVDTSDVDRINESAEELNKLINEEELKNACLLVFANKQDMTHSMKVDQVIDKLGLNALKNKKWFAQGCCAVNGNGIVEGFEWLTKTLNTN
eukprot:TRINITY_DN2628_c0_g1_i1.p1 TRINITY_DN2628_c0_g1~~TRINITY_DN2628_c0_g1_i1.p1  ORF type:complete len:182 (-),score=52.50 TRINITY_DN2628_c0_g1_i1:71-616(-)